MRKHYLSQLAHVEIYSPKPEETLKFYRDVIGLQETERDGQSVYLRAWGDYFHHSLKITEGKKAGLGHIGWRADSAEALELAAKFIEQSGAGKGWIEGDKGHGKAYQFVSPDGHKEEVFWDVDLYKAPPEHQSVWKNRPSKNGMRGISPRRIDHVTLQSSDPGKDREFYQSLGFKYHEGIYTNAKRDKEMGSWLSVSNLSHDVAIVRDPKGERGNINHVCYAVESREEVLLAADHIIESGYRLEMGAPTRHALAEGFFFYVIEPGGNRFELYAGAHLVFAPDFGPHIWTLSENPNDAWGIVSPWNEDGTFKPEFLGRIS
ncbi:VOC family protein [Paenibacillus periandrae]|uniref:VOC family protein n=1 Tax=Paenibacillus periandrae TaxID=1761741 RepID=UPI001F089325|nr:VOC family protein [Paenibacillus periandrae]